MNAIFLAGLILVSGSLGGAVAARCRCPRITGYLVVGILLSPYLFHFVGRETLEGLRVFTTLGLGFIAYEIGASIRTSLLKNLGKSLAWITGLQAFTPWLLSILVITIAAPFIVDVPGSFRSVHLPLALLLGAMACPTAPAVTIALVQECKAAGPMTTLLLGVVGLTDVIAVIAYALAAGISRNLINGDLGNPLFTMVLHPLIEIVQPAAIGLVLAVVLLSVARFITTRTLLLVAVAGFSVLCTGVCEMAGVSTLLANMTLGFVVINQGGAGRGMVLEDIEDIVFTAFFVISGMFFDFRAVGGSAVIALLIIAARCSGKYFGARAGAVLAGADKVTRDYIGLALLPKAGLVIGLAIDARTAFPGIGPILFNGMLASVIINTLLTPPLARYAIRKTGECRT